MKFDTNLWFFKYKKVIQSGKIPIFGKKPEISLRVRLFGAAKKFVPLMKGFPNSGKRWGENRKFSWAEIFLPGEGNLSMSDSDNSNLF